MKIFRLLTFFFTVNWESDSFDFVLGGVASESGTFVNNGSMSRSAIIVEFQV